MVGPGAKAPGPIQNGEAPPVELISGASLSDPGQDQAAGAGTPRPAAHAS